MIKYVTADIQINELHTQRVEVPAWEVPVLEAVHGASVSVTSERLFDRPAPGAEDEFRRLANRYREATNEDGSKGIPYVASVYGQFGVGTANLGRAIAAATEEASQGTDDLLGEQVSSVGG